MDGKLLRNIFFNKQSFRCQEIPCCVCLFLYPCRTEVMILSNNHWTACEASPFRHPFRLLGTPTDLYRKKRYGSACLLWDPAQLLAVETGT